MLSLPEPTKIKKKPKVAPNNADDLQSHKFEEYFNMCFFRKTYIPVIMLDHRSTFYITYPYVDLVASRLIGARILSLISCLIRCGDAHEL